MLAALALHLKGSEKGFVSPGSLISEFPLGSRSLGLSILADKTARNKKGTTKVTSTTERKRRGS